MYGGSSLFRKVDIDLISSPLLASAVTITASWVVAASHVARRGLEFDVDDRELAVFSLAGLSSSIAIPMLYLAFQVGLVVIVTPLMNLVPLLVPGMSFLLFREEEILSRRVLFGTVTGEVGITILTVFGSAS